MSGKDSDEAKEEKFLAFQSGQIRVLWSSPEPVNILDLILGIDRVEVVDEEEVDVFQVAEIMGDTNVDAPIQVFGSAK